MHSLFVPILRAPQSPPIVLVCGLSISSSYMIPAALELARDSDVYCPDLPGFGKSSKPAHALNVPELSDALAAFLQKNGIERAVVAGHSFGCQVAAEFAWKNPGKLTHLVLAAPSGDPAVKSIFRYLARLSLDALREPFSLTPLAVRDYLTAGLLRGFRTFQFAVQDRLDDKLPRIAAPSLVVRGLKDPIVSPEWAARAARLLPDAELVTMESAAHAMNYNSPEKFARIIREFLNRKNSLK